MCWFFELIEIIVIFLWTPPHLPVPPKEEPVCELVSMRTYNALLGYIYVALINASVELFLLHF